MTDTGHHRAEADRDVETHFTVIAIVNLVVAVPGLLLGLGIFLAGLFGAGIVNAFSDVPALGGLLAAGGFLVGLALAVAAIPGIVSATGLLKRRAWAKPWTVLVAILSLFNFPLGTAFGVYALWVMTRDETDVALGRTSAGPR